MSDEPPLPRIAVFAGPTATITNTPLLCFLPGASRFPVIVGSGWDGFLPLPFDGKADHGVFARDSAGVEVGLSPVKATVTKQKVT